GRDAPEDLFAGVERRALRRGPRRGARGGGAAFGGGLLLAALAAALLLRAVGAGLGRVTRGPLGATFLGGRVAFRRGGGSVGVGRRSLWCGAGVSAALACRARLASGRRCRDRRVHDRRGGCAGRALAACGSPFRRSGGSGSGRFGGGRSGSSRVCSGGVRVVIRR